MKKQSNPMPEEIIRQYEEEKMFNEKRKQGRIYKDHIELLGFKGVDKVTGFHGVIDCISFDLYGCVQASLRPPVDKEGKIKDSYWFDITRLEIDKSRRVMDPPNFRKGYIAEGRKGAAPKPSNGC